MTSLEGPCILEWDDCGTPSGGNQGKFTQAVQSAEFAQPVSGCLADCGALSSACESGRVCRTRWRVIKVVPEVGKKR